ncbi:hypothetical protein J7K41_00245, partial [Candidatus Micrarchaeota archaeon]|nr:hypothetical protein [Candidatus Micrarchaeota archaeon]
MVIKIRKSVVFPNPSTQFTKENAAYYEAKGGKKGRIAKSLAKRKKCSPKCPIYDRCIFVAYGIKTGKCPLAEYGKNFKATYFVGSLTNKATLTKV